ncbi:MAG: lipopolysaccharide heptosyltransferase II [Gemmatimonadota bacterium]|nr:lipopolysaccharide heptosyltransferase II [Gemmatimonadota bacterium]
MVSIVIQTSFLGDMVLTTPLIAALAERGPVDVVATPASAGLLANNPSVRAVILYDKRRASRGVRGFGRVLHELRKRRADAIYLAQGSVRSAALAFAAGVHRRVGFRTSAGRPLYSQTVPYRRDLHHAARLWQLATPERDPAPGEIRPRLYPGAAERAAVDGLLGPAHDPRPLVALAPGSVWATKRWPYYKELARAAAADARLAVLGSADDRALAEEILAASSHGGVNAAGRLSLLASAELIGRAALLVTNDSAPQHLASAMDTPTVAIFGPTVPEFGFGPLAPHSIVVGHAALDCRPCDRHGPPVCPLGHWKCMRELTADDVSARVRHLLSTPTPHP